MDRSNSLIHDDETVEALFGGRLKVLQKKKGYRYTIDSILLTHFVRLKEGERVLEIGSGSGVISLVLAFLNPSVRITGIEIQESLAGMARRSVAINDLEGRAEIFHSDARVVGDHLQSQFFDVAVFNPPYRKVGSGRVNPREEKTVARHEVEGSIADFLRAARHALKTGGRLYLIYPCSRMVTALHRMRSETLEPKSLRMIHSKPGSRGDFMLVEGVKGGGEELTTLPPLFIYGSDGRYSEELKAIFKDFSAPDASIELSPS